jgi:nitrite reductase (NO-forming)
MTFDGSVPGPMMVVHEGDYVELTLINPDTNLMPHNIDFHSATGALGGAALTNVNPGEKAVLRFKATKAGVFVYHCAPEGMVPWHVTSGMNGAIMVLPREGLKDAKGNPIAYDRAYYVGEQDFYVPKDADGNYKTYESIGDGYADAVEAMRTLVPSHIVFNGKVGALTGDNALKANVGETVLILHSQANRDTRPHLIGGHGDFVWPTGKFHTPPDVDQETWFIPGGTAGAAVYTFHQPGVYAYVNHNLIEAFEFGAAGHVVVEGEWNDDLMTSVLAPTPL